jgi:hypothetical protein
MTDALSTFKDVMSIMGPFIGIIIGSLMTFWFNIQNEKRRELREKQKTEEVNYKLRNLIKAKLTNFALELRNLESSFKDLSLLYIEDRFSLTKIKSLRNDIDSRPEIFEPEILSELYYTTFMLEHFSMFILDGVRKHKDDDDNKELLEYIKNLQYEWLGGALEKVLKKI